MRIVSFRLSEAPEHAQYFSVIHDRDAITTAEPSHRLHIKVSIERTKHFRFPGKSCRDDRVVVGILQYSGNNWI